MARSVLSNAGWNAFGTLFNIVITFLLAPLLIHRLGVDQWGLLLLVWSVAGVLGIANFGFGEATLRFITHHHSLGNLAGVNRVLGATLTYYSSVCTLICLAIWAAAPALVQWVKAPPGNEPLVEWLIRLTPLLFAVGMITNAFRAVPMALRRYDISNKIGSLQGTVRSIGLVLLVIGGFGVIELVVWEIGLACIVMGVQVAVARRMLPGIRCLPSMSLAGIREIIGYSLFSFATHLFLMVWREGGKLLLGNRLGTASVAYLGTPDSVAGRLHMIVVSAIETLVPQFTAERDPVESKALLTMATWLALAFGSAVYVPLAILMPDFLRLWISAEFAQHSGTVGQLLTLSLIGPAGYAAIATLFRGIGRPAQVTGVMAAVAISVLVASVALIAPLGVVGVAIAYFGGGFVWLGGLVWGWLELYGRGSWRSLVRIVCLPLAIACALAAAQIEVLLWWGEPGWVALFGLGAAFSIVGAAVIVICDVLVGGRSPAEMVATRVLGPRLSTKLVALLKPQRIA